jgi:hypothetical protein
MSKKSETVFNNCVHYSPPLEPALSQMTVNQTLSHSFNIILLFTTTCLE